MARTDWSDYVILGGSDVNKISNEPKQTTPLFVNPVDKNFGWFFSQRKSFGYRSDFVLNSPGGDDYYGGKFMTSSTNFYLAPILLGSDYSNFTHFLDYQFYNVQDLFDDASVSGSWTLDVPGSVSEHDGFLDIETANGVEVNAIWTAKNYYGSVNTVLFDLSGSGDGNQKFRMYLEDETGSSVKIVEGASTADPRQGYQLIIDGTNNKALAWRDPIGTQSYSFSSTDLSTLGGSVWNVRFAAFTPSASGCDLHIRYFVDGLLTSPQSTVAIYGKTDLNSSTAMTEGVESTITSGSFFIGSVAITIAANEVGLFRGGVVTWRET